MAKKTTTTKTSYSIPLKNIGEDTVALDTDNYEAYVKKIKTSLTKINKALTDVKKRYKALENDSKTKGKFKKSVGKIVNGSANKIKKNKAIKNSLEASILRSTTDMNEALRKANKDLEEKANLIPTNPTDNSTPNPTTTGTPTPTTTEPTPTNPDPTTTTSNPTPVIVTPEVIPTVAPTTTYVAPTTSGSTTTSRRTGKGNANIFGSWLNKK